LFYQTKPWQFLTGLPQKAIAASDLPVLQFIETQGKQALRERLKLEALANAERDVALASEWFPLEEEAAGHVSAARRLKKSHKTN